MSYTLRDGLISGDVDSAQTTCICVLCNSDITSLAVEARQRHYERHFGEEDGVGAAAAASKPSSSGSGSGSGTLMSFWGKGGSGGVGSGSGGRNNDRGGSNNNNNHGSSSSSKNTSSSSPAKSKFSDMFSPRKYEKDDLFWHAAQSPSLVPRNYAPGLIPLLKTHLGKSHSNGYTRRAVLCYDRAVLVNRMTWDAYWGCGYRNYLMACAALMDQQLQPMYFPLLDSPIPPSIFNLQRIIEDAWRAGFDPEGAKELKSLVGTRTKIGAADIQVAFTFRGIPSLLVEFDLDEKGGGADVLINWTMEYFSKQSGLVDTESARKRKPQTVNDLWGAAPVSVTSRMPFILQHDGHSRTIIGYEVTKLGEVNLLQFDPSMILRDNMRKAALATFAAQADSPTTSTASTSSKRAAPASLSGNPTPAKRSRKDENEVIEIDDDEDDEVVFVPQPPRQKLAVKPPRISIPDVSTAELLKHFRLQPKKIIKNKKYQVLYFPMTAPLTEKEKQSRSANGYGEKVS
ncbi:hypothetical protein HMN09_00030800 [Mycena chlorophos]|uniref:UFSP1/2/DUB catalytic domain-containing protein n=1 Tax=Mycena chlorophos TaxID=658473 RepID=A0A8H6TR87_MYCCL|nr:hypothetical protein HMN09_00030800 [Mycena chlorophos]